jgi:S-adenosylmethionine-diacylglycerol 3-amino-3-carboxypropyl transferase
VDSNPRQTALVELKIAAIRELEHPDFFSIFGRGRHREFRPLYRDRLRPHLSPFARRFWDGRTAWFSGRGWRNSFFWYGLSGLFARLARMYTASQPNLRRALDELLACRNLETQQRIFKEQVEPKLWNKGIELLLRRSVTMTLLGIPFTQRREVQAHFGNDLPQFIRAVTRHVFMNVPIWKNYFWTLYMRGHYTEDCCPEYLVKENYERLKEGMVDCIELHTCSVTEFLRKTPDRISKFVLLDHMDWMSEWFPEALAEEWEQILHKARPGARVIFRSGAGEPDYLNQVRIKTNGSREFALLDRLKFNREQARELHATDRVCTYNSFHIADIEVA